MKFNTTIHNVNVHINIVLGDDVDSSPDFASVLFGTIRDLGASAGCGNTPSTGDTEPDARNPGAAPSGDYDEAPPTADPVTGFFGEDAVTTTEDAAPAVTQAPELEVEETVQPTTTDAAVLNDATDDYAALGDDALNAVAFGENGKNKAKLAWALRHVYSPDNDIIGPRSDFEADDLLYRIQLPELVGSHQVYAYINLYRARDGYAKAGSAKFGSAFDARRAASGSNYVGTVALI